MKKMLVLIAAALSVIVGLFAASKAARTSADYAAPATPTTPAVPAATGSSSPASTGLTSPWQAQTGYALKWNALSDPGGQVPASYTIETLQLDGVKVDQFTTTRPGRSNTVRVVPACIPAGLTRPMCGPTTGYCAPHATIQVALPSSNIGNPRSMRNGSGR